MAFRGFSTIQTSNTTDVLVLLMVAVLLITVHSCFAGMSNQHATIGLKMTVSDYHHTHNAGMYPCTH